MKISVFIISIFMISCQTDSDRLSQILHGKDYKLWTTDNRTFLYFDKNNNKTVFCHSTPKILKECEGSDLLMCEDWIVISKDSILIGYQGQKVVVYSEDSVKIGELTFIAVPQNMYFISNEERAKAGKPLRCIRKPAPAERAILNTLPILDILTFASNVITTKTQLSLTYK